VTLKIDGRESEWLVVGKVPASADGPRAFVPYDHYSQITRLVGQTNTLKIITSRHDGDFQGQMATRLEEWLESNGITVASTRTTEHRRTSTEFQFNIVIAFLVMMAVLLAMVGGLGLTTTMSINILERIREIGVMRAIGASDSAVRQIVVAEGILIAVVSWGVGSLLAYPIGRLLSEQIGLALLRIPLDYSYAVDGMFLWLILVVLIAIVATLGPARTASRLTIREVLAYE
jgi:putative ABC transport system permease protein